VKNINKEIHEPSVSESEDQKDSEDYKHPMINVFAENPNYSKKDQFNTLNDVSRMSIK
jgi:hypothetical protein